MKRFKDNPIITPISGHYWETRLVFNAAALQADGGVHILYRAMGDDGVSRLGYAMSSDGYTIDKRHPEPVFVPSNPVENLGVEDPRLTLMDDNCYLTYTAYRNQPITAYQVGLTNIVLKDMLSGNWNWGPRTLPFPSIRDKNAVLFPRKINGNFVMYHRLEPDICVSYSEDLKRWFGLKGVAHPRPNMWDCRRIGAAGPPMEINEGWLFIYHGVDYNNVYRLGVMLIDKNNPERVLYRSEEPILEPVEHYELFGKVPKVVFSCGHVIMDNMVLVYYGGADTVLCGAEYELSELLP